MINYFQSSSTKPQFEGGNIKTPSKGSHKKSSPVQHTKQKFSERWLKDPIKKKYVEKIENDEFSFYCKKCQNNYSCESIYHHINSHEVQNKPVVNPNQTNLVGYIADRHQKDRFDFELTKFITLNNLPFSITEPLIELCQKLKEKDLINYADSTNLTRQKASVILSHGITPSLIESMDKLMETQPYSLIVDEGADKVGKTFLAISIQFLKEGHVCTKLYSLIHLNEDYTGETFYKIVNERILNTSAKKKNVISLVTDGAGNMRGCDNGLSSRMEEQMPYILTIHCTAHVLSLILERATTAVFGDMVELIKSISNTFAFSNQKKELFNEIQSELDLKPRKILRYVPTRWLSLGHCVTRTLEEYKALCEFYKKYEELNSFTNKQLANPFTYPKLQYFNFFLKKFNKLSEDFQSQETLSYHLVTKIEDFYMTFARMILKSDYKSMTYSQITNIDLVKNEEVEKYFLSPLEFIADIKKERLKFEVEWSLIPEKNDDLIQNGIADQWHELVLEILHKIQVYMSERDEIVEDLRCLDLCSYNRNSWVNLISRFDNLYSKDDYPTLIEELNKMETKDLFLYSFEQNAIKRWQKFESDSHCHGLCRIAITLLTIPSSSASVERVFSQLKLVKNDRRANLQNDTLQGCLLIS